jgi:hypothetical protein
VSALIFVALAVAWAVYLIPQALKHHEAGDSSRGVERFSDRMRVLARREAVDRRTARLVVPGRPAVAAESNADVAAVAPSIGTDAPAVAPAPSSAPSPALLRARRERARAATRRRRRVLLVLLAPLVVVGGLAATGILAPVWVALPAVLLVAWLVTCRVMVRQERRPAVRSAASAGPLAPLADDEPDDGGPMTEEFDVVLDEVADDAPVAADPAPEPEPAEPAPSAGWDPVAVQLPTYVTKPAAARRTVRTIDLDSTGVWTSGRTAADSALAREADEAARAERATPSAAERARQQRRA